MFVIACKLGSDTYYVPDEFNSDGSYPEDVSRAKKFNSPIAALTFMMENAYDSNDWYRWEVVAI